MNNINSLFKYIFLLVNVISATSSASNSSIPLSKEELTVGKNSSQIDEGERRKPDFPYLHGGMKVIGLSWVDNLPNQRSCTLSFPVYRTDDKTLGFLTSYLCSGDAIFVNGDEAGSIDQPNNLLSDPGLDYTFVVPISNYWSDEISSKIDYSQCASTGRGIVDIDKPLPIIPIPNQHLSVGDKVYAHGGNSGTVHGVILETGVKISVQNPAKEDPFYLYDVVKVQMSKPYSGDLGAPVYIPLSVPDSNQFVASPVGQVVELKNWDIKTSEHNIWYYIPIDRILEDSKLTIASGNLSYLLPPNNTESSNDSLSDDLTKESNVSDINNLVRRQPGQPRVVDVYAGNRMWNFKVATQTPHTATFAEQCTFGFAVRKVLGRVRFDHGFLTLGSCMHGNLLGIPNARNSAYYTPNQNWVREEAVFLGSVSSLKHDPANGLSYAILRLTPNNEEYTLWNDDRSTKMPVENVGRLEFVEVSNQPYLQSGLSARQELCWWGSASGHMCGTIAHSSTPLIKFNPWKWPIYLDVVVPLVVNGLPIPEQYRLLDPEDHFQGLIKVRLDEPRQPRAEEHKHDRGSPVYFPYFDRLGLITRVKPVGILLDYVQEDEESNGQCVRVWYMYCISVDKIIRNSRSTLNDLELIGENFA